MPTTRRHTLLGLAALAAGPALAQALGSPLGAAPAGATGPVEWPHGQGPGVHSPQSPIAPLPKRGDVVAWSLLTDVKTEVKTGAKGKRIVPVYPPEVRALDQRRLKLHGFMLPLEPGENQRHFLLASVPLTCSFCTPGGAESLVEVRTKTPVKYRLEAVVVEGRFHVLDNDPYGLYYRLSEAEGSR